MRELYRIDNIKLRKHQNNSRIFDLKALYWHTWQYR